MKKRIIIRIYFDEPEEMKGLEPIREFIKEAIIEEKFGAISWEITLEPSRPEYSLLLREIAKKDLSYGYWEERTYTTEEMEGAELYHMELYDPWELSPKCAKDFGTTYAKGIGCAVCFKDAKQTSPLLLNLKKAPLYHIGMIFPAMFISKEIKEHLERNGITGIR